tara:strand:+ start:414 stop:692 length:279 start_codon:yes stop_codon:yes gene_type:complete
MFKEKVFTETCINGDCKKTEYYREINDGVETVKKLTDDIIIDIFNKANNILPLDIRLQRDFKSKPKSKSRKVNKKDKKKDKKKSKKQKKGKK